MSTRRSMTAPAARVGSRSILLAEHEPEVAEMSARYLRRDGLRVRLVTTPEQALAELTGGPAAAAVLDLTMPGLDPRRIRRALRTPVIFLVAGPQGPRPRGLARGGPAGPRRGLRRRPLTKRTRTRFQGGSRRGSRVAGLPSVAQQFRCEGTSEPRECARRDPRRRACRSRRTAAARLA